MSVETVNPVGAVTVIFADRLFPPMLSICEAEFCPTFTLPKCRTTGLFVIAAKGVLIPVPLTVTFCVVAPVALWVIEPE